MAELGLPKVYDGHEVDIDFDGFSPKLPLRRELAENAKHPLLYPLVSQPPASTEGEQG